MKCTDFTLYTSAFYYSYVLFASKASIFALPGAMSYSRQTRIQEIGLRQGWSPLYAPLLFVHHLNLPSDCLFLFALKWNRPETGKPAIQRRRFRKGKKKKSHCFLALRVCRYPKGLVVSSHVGTLVGVCFFLFFPCCADKTTAFQGQSEMREPLSFTLFRSSIRSPLFVRLNSVSIMLYFLSFWRSACLWCRLHRLTRPRH